MEVTVRHQRCPSFQEVGLLAREPVVCTGSVSLPPACGRPEATGCLPHHPALPWTKATVGIVGPVLHRLPDPTYNASQSPNPHA